MFQQDESSHHITSSVQLCGHGIFLTHCFQHESVRIDLYPDKHIAASLFVNKTQKLKNLSCCPLYSYRMGEMCAIWSMSCISRGAMLEFQHAYWCLAKVFSPFQCTCYLTNLIDYLWEASWSSPRSLWFFRHVEHCCAQSLCHLFEAKPCEMMATWAQYHHATADMHVVVWWSCG